MNGNTKDYRVSNGAKLFVKSKENDWPSFTFVFPKKA